MEKSTKIDSRDSKIMKDRASLYAKQVKKDEDFGALVEGLEFLLKDEPYIIESKFIVEVIPLKDLALLPCTPPFILGIINVRGRILSVVNIKSFLNIPEKGLASLNRVIILKNDQIELGVLVDEIIGKTEFYPDHLMASRSGEKKASGDFIRGLTAQKSIVLDVETFLANNQLIINEEV